MTRDFAKIKELNKKIEDLLEENPELIPLQNEINERLEKVGKDHQKRNQVIQEMLVNSWMRITEIGEI